MPPEEIQAYAPQFAPLSVLRALWKWKLLIIVMWLSGSTVSILVIRRLPAVYVATALIQVDPEKIPEKFVPTTVANAIEVRMDRLKQQVLSRERLWQLVEDLGLYLEERRRLTQEEAIELMRSDISIELEKSWSAGNQPVAFRVEYSSSRPMVVAEVANRIAAFFVDENLRQREAEAAGASEFLNAQLIESDRQLREQEAKLKEFKLAHVGGLPEQEAALLATMSQSRTELEGIQDGLARAQQNKIVLENSLAIAEANLRDLRNVLGPAEGAVTPPGSKEADQVDLEIRAARLRYHDAHPEVQRLLRERERLATEAAREVRRRQEEINDNSEPPLLRKKATVPTEQAFLAAKQQVSQLTLQISQTTTEMESLEARRRQVLRDLAENQILLKNIPVREQQLASIMRDYETSKLNYDSLLNKKLTADVATELEKRQQAQRFVLLESARIPEKPVKPKRIPLMIGGILGSLMLAVASAFLLELRRNVILGEWELPPGTVVLGRIPRMQSA